ncbi:MAG: DUF1553 domain-containing protein [Planctomycetales bacterium]|nr:DUF1553 domain-containing protein [Planctomycetales bacterium]
MRFRLVCVVATLVLAANASAATIDFDTQIIPILTKVGCNSGACHGAAAGRGNFHLSLLGANPAADYAAIVHEFQGRRVNLAEPDRSLVLAKPTGGLEHGGDMLLSLDSPAAELIREWISSGAKRAESRHLQQLQITPLHQVITEIPGRVRVQATAIYSETEAVDVTRWVSFTSTDTEAAQWNDEAFEIRVNRRGVHTLIARFLDRVVTVEVVVPFNEHPVDLSREPRVNYIDDHVLQTLTTLNVPPSELADDAEFLRRVQLDLVGRLPTRDAVNEFLSAPAEDKRMRWIDKLLASEDFADYWTLRFARWFGLHSFPNDSESVATCGDWLHTQISNGASIRSVAQQLLLATGDSHVVGPATFSRLAADPRAHAELVGRVFMGARIGCANCHNHPLDRWTQDDYHGLAAVFAKLDRGRVVRVLARGAVTNVRTNEPAIPRIPGTRDLDERGDHRAEVADWLLSDERLAFSEVMANRIWQAMFGRGLIDPTDDVRPTNPCTHPELLRELAADWRDHDYDLRQLLRRIANSRTYQRSHSSNNENQSDDRFYSHARSRPLPAEVLAEALSDVLDVQTSHITRVRFVTQLDPLKPAPELDLLGRCTRSSDCGEVIASPLGLTTRLHLMNGELLNDRLSHPQSRLHRGLSLHHTPVELVEEFYQSAFCRRPSADEAAYWQQQLANDDEAEQRRRLEDFVWSLLSSNQFITNH